MLKIQEKAVFPTVPEGTLNATPLKAAMKILNELKETTANDV